MAQLLIQMENICKEFSGVRALAGVSFDLWAGEIHALVGENGAGKSTLMKVLTGVYTKDSGLIKVRNQEVSISGILDSQGVGIVMIHQELNLMNHLTVAQNIFIGSEELGKLFLNDAKLNRHAWKIMIYVVSGMFSAAAGLIMSSRFGSAQPQHAAGYELEAIAEAIIGGTSMSGGEGSIT